MYVYSVMGALQVYFALNDTTTADSVKYYRGGVHET